MLCAFPKSIMFLPNLLPLPQTRVKKSGYKYQLEQALLKAGWEIKLIDARSEWWEEEHWVIRAQHHYPELLLYISFMVDPMPYIGKFKRPLIESIEANTVLPVGRLDSEKMVARLSLSKRKFDVKLAEFIERVTLFRKGRLGDP